jgi:hypothetical protein
LWSVDAPHSGFVFVVGGVAFGDPEADKSAPLQTDLVVELAEHIFKIVTGTDRLCDQFVEARPSYFKPKYFVRQAPNILGEGLDLRTLDDRSTATTT